MTTSNHGQADFSAPILVRNHIPGAVGSDTRLQMMGFHGASSLALFWNPAFPVPGTVLRLPWALFSGTVPSS